MSRKKLTEAELDALAAGSAGSTDADFVPAINASTEKPRPALTVTRAMLDRARNRLGHQRCFISNAPER